MSKRFSPGVPSMVLLTRSEQVYLTLAPARHQPTAVAIVLRRSPRHFLGNNNHRLTTFCDDVSTYHQCSRAQV
jgi:hypothetical protein